jgi:uncharacterized protein
VPGNAAIVRRGYEAFNAGDLATLGELVGDLAALEAVFARLGRYAAETGGTFRADPTRVLTDEDGRVIVIQHNVGERDGKHLDVYSCVVFELENGRIVGGREHVYDLLAWDEFWA